MMTASLLPRVVALSAALVALHPAPARAQRVPDAERLPVDLPSAGDPSSAVGGGGSIVRTIVGLAIVIAVIYGISWVLRQLRHSRSERAIGVLTAVGSVPLGAGKALHLVRVGNELVLVGAADHGVTPIRTYTEAEAQAVGLIDEWGEVVEVPLEELGATVSPSVLGRRRRLPTVPSLIETIRRWTVRR